MSYLPVLLGLVTAVCWGTSDFLSRSQSQKVGQYNTAVYMCMTTLLMLLVLARLAQRDSTRLFINQNRLAVICTNSAQIPAPATWQELDEARLASVGQEKSGVK